MRPYIAHVRGGDVVKKVSTRGAEVAITIYADGWRENGRDHEYAELHSDAAALAFAKKYVKREVANGGVVISANEANAMLF